MKYRPILTILKLLLLSLVGCGSPDSWNGSYTYLADYGETAGGGTLFLEYVVSISESQSCHISINGHMTMDEIDCQLEIKGSSVMLSFVSFDGKKTNAYGVEVYKPLQPLLKLEKEQDKIVTHWLGLNTLDGETPKSGVYFKRQKI